LPVIYWAVAELEANVSVEPALVLAESALPGGTSAVPTSPYYLNLLRPYLTDDHDPARLATELRPTAIADVLRVVPGKRAGSHAPGAHRDVRLYMCRGLGAFLFASSRRQQCPRS
jgi:hypothetical protein